MAPMKAKPPVLQLDDIAGYKVAETADHIAERHHSRSRAYLEMGKLIYHLENRAGMRRNQTVYGVLGSRGVPEGSVNNGRLAATFIATFVVPGLVSEARCDEVLTSRIARQTSRILRGKGESGVKMAPEDLASVLSEGEAASIGDELDCLAEHGMTISDKEDADRQADDERRRMEAAAKAAEAAEAAPESAATPEPAPEPVESPNDPADQSDPTDPPEAAAGAEAEAATPEETPAETPEETPEPTPAPEITPAKGATPAPTPPPAPEDHTLAGVLEMIDEAQLASFDLDPSSLGQLKERLTEWVDQIDESLAALQPEAVAA